MKIKLWVATIMVGFLCGTAVADISTFDPTAGFMNVFELNGTLDGPAAYQFGSSWGVPDLKTLTSDDLTFELFPNVNTYADNPGDAYWRNNGGAGPDGNKWLEATTFRQYILGVGETGASLDFNVGAFDLDGRYTLTAFIKTLETNTFTVTAIDSTVLTGAAGTTTLSISGLAAGEILQVGFQMDGINANPVDDWGSATATFESVDVIPEPATALLIGIFGGGMFAYRRYLKIN